MDAREITGKILGAFLPPVQEKLEEKHKQEQAENATVRASYLKMLFDPETSEQGRQSAMKALKPLFGKQAFESLTNAFPIVQKLSQFGQQQGQQPTPGQNALPGPQQPQGPREAAMAPQQSPGAAALPPPPGGVMAGYGDAQRKQKEADLDAAEQRKVRAARDMIPVDVEKQKAMAPGRIREAKDVARAQMEMQSEEFKSKIDQAQKILGHEFSPKQLEEIALSSVGVKDREGSSNERIELKGPDGKILSAFRDPVSGKIYDPTHKEIDMTQGYEVVEKSPASTNSTEVKDLKRLNELKRKPDTTPEEKDELQALEYRKKQLDDLGRRADTRLNVTLQNAAASNSSFDIKPNSKEYREAQKLSTGDLTLSQLKSIYSRGKQDSEKRAAILDLAEQLNPSFSAAKFEAGYNFFKSPKIRQQLSSLNNVESGIPDILRFSDLAERSGATILNKAVIPGGIAIGKHKYSDFATARTAFADELSGALGYGTATDMSREMGFDMTNQNLSPENFRSAIENVVVPFVARKKASILGQMGPYGADNFQDQSPGSHAMEKPPPASSRPRAKNPKTGEVMEYDGIEWKLVK